VGINLLFLRPLEVVKDTSILSKSKSKKSLRT